MKAQKKTNAQPVVATAKQVTALFSKPFIEQADLSDAATKAMLEAELTTGTAFYEQGADVIDRLGIKTESSAFKAGVDKRATKSGNGSPKTESERVNAFITGQLKKYKKASVRKIFNACAAILEA